MTKSAVATGEVEDSTTLSEAVQIRLAELGLTIDDVTYKQEYPIVDKASLVGVPFYIERWRFGLSKNFAHEYVSAEIIRLDNGLTGTLFDSGSGIYEQMSDISDKRERQGKPANEALYCPEGLTVSSYAADADKGRPAGTTYYLA